MSTLYYTGFIDDEEVVEWDEATHLTRSNIGLMGCSHISHHANYLKGTQQQ